MEQKAFAKKIHKLCLPPDIYFRNELYFRGAAQIYTNSAQVQNEPRSLEAITQELVIPKGETISFDTYFNMFPLFKWRHYTKIQDICVDIALIGTAEVSLWGINKDNSKDDVKILDVKIGSKNAKMQRIFTSFEIKALPDFIYLSVTALDDRVKLKDFTFCTNASQDEKLNIACCFCTYKREQEVKKNIQNLLSGIVHNKASALYDRLHIYVSDNGHTLPLDMYSSEPAVHLFYNKNCGGSAGFTRCMIESCLKNKEKPFTHVILMDDDALILSDVVERTGAFLSVLKDEFHSHMIGGAWLLKETPSVQRVSGEFQDLKHWGRTYCGHNMDLCNKNEVLENEIGAESEMNYNGWWYTCIPSNFITDKNLPLPLFLHLDDVEYGIRNDGKFIRLNGICVWHPNNTNASKQKSYVAYYDMRNSLMLLASYCPEKGVMNMFSYLLKRICVHIVNYRYQSLWHACTALNDFYRGIDYFEGINAEKMNGTLMKQMPYETCVFSKDNLKKANIRTFQDIYKSGENAANYEKAMKIGEKNAPSYSKKQILVKLLNWFVPAYKGKVVYSDEVLFEDIDFFGTKEICVVNPKTGVGLRFRKSYIKALQAALAFLLTSFKICLNHRKIYKEWHDRIHELESYDFWKSYLGL